MLFLCELHSAFSEMYLFLCFFERYVPVVIEFLDNEYKHDDRM